MDRAGRSLRRLAWRIAAMALAGAVLACPLSALADAAASGGGAQAQFTDVASNWAVGDIDTLLEAGVLAVPPDGMFRPSDPVNRADFTVWMAKALELTPPSTPPRFEDIAGLPTADQSEIEAAAGAGLVQGYPGGLFAPAQPISRAELATIFGRALQAKGEVPEARYFQIFLDGDSVPAWALPAAIIVKDQLMYGEPCTPEACFAPQRLTTRAEAVTLIVRFMQYLTAHYHQAPLPKPTISTHFVLGMWYSNSDEAYANLQAYGNDVNELVYGGYSIENGGALVGYDSPRTLAWASKHSAVPLWVMVQADSLSFLGNAAQTEAMLDNLLAIVRRAGYAGVNFDIEGIPGADRQLYSDFIAEASARLHAMGDQVSVAVPSEQANNLGEWWDAAYDYPALGRSVDQLIMMAYDYHYAGGNPGPVSPIAWDQAVISYAKSVMAPSKVFLGMPLYGYVWKTSNDSGTAYWISGMENTAAQHGAVITRDGAYDEATFSYTSGGAQYVGWYVDGQGAADRIRLAHDAGIGGVVAWRMDYDAPTWWTSWTQALANWA